MPKVTYKNKLIVILGPTSSGKSDLAVLIAKKFNGEIISADSRQVYRGMDIGTGKVTKKEMSGIPHHLLDVADPKRKYSVSRFKREAEKAITQIIKRGKIPILCGGTGFYIQAVVDNLILPKVRANAKLRKKLNQIPTKELFLMLKKLDCKRSKTIDIHNPHRLIRAIEIATELGAVPALDKSKESKFEVLQIGIKTPKEVLQSRIIKRLDKRLKRGMVAEVKRLHTEGISYKRMVELGLEYKFISLFLSKDLSKDDAIKQLTTASFQYAKRQMTWFKKDKRTHWVLFEDTQKTFTLVKGFLYIN